MPLVNLIVALVIIGVVLYLINNFVPMDAKIKTLINVIIVLAICLWLLQSIGWLGGGGPYLWPPRR